MTWRISILAPPSAAKKLQVLFGLAWLDKVEAEKPVFAQGCRDLLAGLLREFNRIRDLKGFEAHRHSPSFLTGGPLRQSESYARFNRVIRQL
jgi:hypothetical protein